MRNQRFIVSLALGVLLGSSALAAPSRSGSAIEGVVRDVDGGILPGSTVSVSPASAESEAFTVYADGAGAFKVDGLLPGTYTVVAILDGFEPSRSTVTLVADQVVTLEFRLALKRLEDSIEVTAERVTSGEVSILDRRRQAGVVSDAMSSEEIAKSADSDAASAVDRLTGITVLEDKYVYVRGLGERYSNTTLNGASLASTETEKRVVPLDLFPAKLLDSIDVVKSYTPDRPGTFGSGVVELVTLNFPSSQQFKVSLGAAHESAATGDAFARYAGGLDWQGKGGQALPGAIPNVLLAPKTRFNPNGFTGAEMERFGEAFGRSWGGESSPTAPLNRNASLSYSNSFGPVGVVLAGVTSHGFHRREEIQRFFGVDANNTLVANNDYTLVTDTERVRNGLVAAVAVRVAEGHRLQLSSLATMDAASSYRVQEGYQSNGSYIVRDYRSRYDREKLTISKLAGEHFLPAVGQGSSLDWSFSISNATRTSDMRENLYGLMGDGVFRLLTGYPEVGRMEFFDLDDEVKDGTLSWTMFYSGDGGRYGSVKLGGAYTQRGRDFSARRFKFVANNPGQFDLSLMPHQLFTPENIRPDGFEIREVTGINDAYSGDHTVTAAFLMGDASVGKWRFIGGLRLEDSEQSVTTVNPFDTAHPVVARLDNRDVLPALNVVYVLSRQTNLRVAASRTLNRPEFRELSPFTFVEVTGGRSVAGNPDLKQATLDGLDLRWETFPDAGDVMAASAFYKRIQNPIERYVQATTELRSSWTNADSATLKGIELELRRSLGVVSPVLRLWSVNLNYSFIDSNVTIPATALSVITNGRRDLQGQAKHVGNVALQFHQPNWGTLVRLLYAYTGSRLTDVGAYGVPDIFEEGARSLDLVLVQRLAAFLRGLEVKLTGSNLTDPKRVFTQGGQVQRAYRSGRAFGLSLAYSL